MKASMNFTRKRLPGFGCFVESALQTSAHLAEMAPDRLFAEASMVAASMDAFADVVVTVPRLHRHI